MQSPHLEAQVKLVHDVTGRPINEIRTDLEYTGDPHTTITRIMEGEFLKWTPRDPEVLREREIVMAEMEQQKQRQQQQRMQQQRQQQQRMQQQRQQQQRMQQKRQRQQEQRQRQQEQRMQQQRQQQQQERQERQQQERQQQERQQQQQERQERQQQERQQQQQQQERQQQQRQQQQQKQKQKQQQQVAVDTSMAAQWQWQTAGSVGTSAGAGSWGGQFPAMQSFQQFQPLQPSQPLQALPLPPQPPPPLPPPHPQPQPQPQVQMQTQDRERASGSPGKTVQFIDLCGSDDEVLLDGPPVARWSTSTPPASPPRVQMRRLTIDAPAASFDISTEQPPRQSTNNTPPRINDRFVPPPPPAVSTPAERTSARSLSTTVSAPGERSGFTMHAQSTAPGPLVSTPIERPRPLPPAPSTPVERYHPDALQTPAPTGGSTAPIVASSAPAADRNTDRWTAPVRPRQPPTFASERPLPYRKWGSGAAAGPSSNSAAPVGQHLPPPPPPQQPVLRTSQSPPLFRYQSSSPSPSPPLSERTKPKVVTRAGFRYDPAIPTMRPPLVVSKTPVALEAPIAPERVKLESSPRKKQKAMHVDVILIDSDPDGHASVLSTDSMPELRKHSSPTEGAGLSTATRSLLQEFKEEMLDSEDDDGELVVGGDKKRKKKAPARRKGKAPAKAKVDVVDIVDIGRVEGADDPEESDITLLASPSKGGRNRLSEAEKARRAVEKEAAKQQRLKEREAKAAEREEAKAQKKRENEARELERKQEQELALVNKLRTSKKDSAPEMIVDISQHLKDHATGQSLLRFLTGLGCEVNTTWYPPLPAGGAWRIVKWRRKAKAEWDESRGLFIPLPELKVTDEEHVLVYLTAQEFLQASKRGLGEHIALLRGFSPLDPAQVRPIYVVEGMEVLIRKNKNNRNRAYQNRVRAVLGEDGSVPADADVLDEDAVQDMMLEAQVVHGCLVHHTATGIESAEWISRFTGDISTIPYRNSRTSIDVCFCADIGQVRVGVGKTDIYLRMLEQINRVTPSVAASIESVYPDVQTLIAAFKDQGEDALADIPNQMARNGLERNLGPSISRRVCAIFMDADPESVEI